MTADDRTGRDDERAEADPLADVGEIELDDLQRLLLSVEELRALLAPLSEEDRRRVLDLARSLRRQAESGI